MAANIKITVPSYAFTVDKKLLRKTLRAAGSEVAAVARALILRSQGGGASYSKPGGGRYHASAPGQPPVSRTGVLAASLSVKPSRSGDRVTVRDSAYYALILEAGAKGGAGSGKKGVKGRRNKQGKSARPTSARVLEPRPFLSVAALQRQDSIAERVRAAMVDGIKFQRIKA